jgi:DNA repair protein RecO (recombination protein O)
MYDTGEATRGDGALERRARLYRAHGVILRRRELGETDRIVTIFTREHGKQRVVAKGTRRPGSRLAGHLEPFMVTNVLIARGRNLDIISQAECLTPFSRLRTDERAIGAAGLCAELIDSLTAEDQPHPQVFELLTGSLDLLEQGADPRRVTLVFEHGLLASLGYRPEVQRCTACGQDLEPVPCGFSLDAGGVVCHRCMRPASGLTLVSVDALKVLRMLDRGDVTRVLKLRIPDPIIDEVDRLLADYVRQIVGKDSQARRVLSDLRLEYDYDSQI